MPRLGTPPRTRKAWESLPRNQFQALNLICAPVGIPLAKRTSTRPSAISGSSSLDGPIGVNAAGGRLNYPRWRLSFEPAGGGTTSFQPRPSRFRRSNCRDKTDAGERDKVERNRPGLTLRPCEKARRHKGREAAADRRADLEAERRATVSQSPREKLGIPWRADAKAYQLPESDGRNNRHRDDECIFRVQEPKQWERESTLKDAACVKHRLA